MRIFAALSVILLVSLATVGEVHFRDTNSATTARQVSPSTTPKCIEPPDPPGGCHISKHNKEFIRWQAPPNEDMYVCFDSPYPFRRKNYHISAGSRKDSGPIVLQPPPTTGTEFDYYYGNQPCTTKGLLNTAKVIVDN